MEPFWFLMGLMTVYLLIKEKLPPAEKGSMVREHDGYRESPSEVESFEQKVFKHAELLPRDRQIA